MVDVPGLPVTRSLTLIQQGNVPDTYPGELTLYVDVAGNLHAKNGAGVDVILGSGSTGTVTGTGAANRVAVWSGVSSVTSDVNFNYFLSGGTTPILSLGKTPQNYAGTGIGQLQTHSVGFTDNAGQYIINLHANSSLAGNYDITLPISQGAAGTTISNDGTGFLTWVPAGITGSGVTNRLAIWSSSSGLTSDQNLEYTSFGTPTFSVGKTPSNSGATGNGVLETHTLALTDNAGGYLISLSAPASLGGSYTLTMPGVQGSNGNTFINDGTGGLTWGAPVGTVPQFVNTAGGTSANITVGVVNYFYQVAGGSGNATFALPSNNAGSSNMLFTVINSNVGSVILSIPSGVTVLLPSGVALTGPATYTGSTSYCAITLVSVQFSNSYNIISQTGSWS
jgi:hypothetical protein